ncbi:MAG: hypothetical protein ACM3SV_04320 [Betaproteobacteria bacterium]
MSTKLIALLLAVSLPALAGQVEGASTANTVPAQAAASDSVKLEKALQRLDWPQFKSVVEAVPQLKSQVDAYGKLGWQYVQANYKTYGWRKSINKLDDEQKQQLRELIHKAETRPDGVRTPRS